VEDVFTITGRGTVVTGRVVRGERLDLARDRLTDPRWAARGISFIADSVGYGSASAFSTAFGRRFGRTPRAHRAGAAD
ncbi:helix-turn-helix domain-containing protein, partial [Tsukamurella tyrosinosolvens]|uniref:helix-turn-helix domain-containing protein n=1 Tax=Tsukamurella tyrosinosolvens TaxID=57704 RepID=UPI00247FE232